MRILFYLPTVTPWWFANIVVHVIRTLAEPDGPGAHEVHVMVPPLWRGTGIGKEETSHIEALPHVHWHLLNGPDHPRLRLDASGENDLIEFVETIAPGLTLCRSADVQTPALFPGEVRYLMEGAAAPYQLGDEALTLKTQLFDHGFIPAMPPNLAQQLGVLAEEIWDDWHRMSDMPERAQFLADAEIEGQFEGQLEGRRLIGLPLEYEHPENFFVQHHAFASNADMVRAVASELADLGELGDDTTLLITHHPLTELHGDVSAVNAAIMEYGGRVKLLRRTRAAAEGGYDTTLAMARHCDGIVVGNSKSWSICAVLGTPMVRLSSAPTAPWVNAYDTLKDLLRDCAEARAKAAEPAATKRWLAYHILNAVFDPKAADLTAKDVLGHAFNPVDPARWDAAMARYRAINPPPTFTKEAAHA